MNNFRRFLLYGFILFSFGMLIASGTDDSKYEDKTIDSTKFDSTISKVENPRIELRIGHVRLRAGDSLAIVPVFLSNPYDAVAGLELYVSIRENSRAYFAVDDFWSDGTMMAADTSGTLLSGWEWVGLNNPGNSWHELKIAGLADWPNEKITSPIQPQPGDTLVKLLIRIDQNDRLSADTTIDIRVIGATSSFADAVGNTVGITPVLDSICQKYVADSCFAWKVRRVANRDTNVVRFFDGSISIIDSL